MTDPHYRNINEKPKFILEYNTLLVEGKMVPRYPKCRAQVSKSNVSRFLDRALKLGKNCSSSGWRSGKAFTSKQFTKVAKLVRQTTNATVVVPSNRVFARESVSEHELSILDTGNQSEFNWQELKSEVLENCDRMLDMLARCRVRTKNFQDRYFRLNECSTIPYSISPSEQQDELAGGARSPIRRLISRTENLKSITIFSARNKRLASDLTKVCVVIQELTLEKLRTFLDNLTCSSDEEEEKEEEEEEEENNKVKVVVGEWSRLY